MKELTITIRGNKISLQGAGIGKKKKQAAAILAAALEAMKNDKLDQEYLNEIIYFK